MIRTDLCQSDAMCAIRVTCGDRTATGLLLCYPPFGSDSAQYGAKFTYHRRLDPKLDPYAVGETITDEITGEDREQMATWLTKKMMPVVVNLRIHDRMQSHEGDYDD